MPIIGTPGNLKGPSQKKLESFTVCLSGTKVSFSVPRSNNHRQIPRPPPKELNLYDASIFRADTDTVEPVPATGIMHRWYNFHGLPIIHGALCYIVFNIHVLRLENFPTLFRPLHFQKAIERCIFTEQGPAARKFSYICRKHWRIDHYPGGVWAHYDNVSQPLGTGNVSYWHLPLTESHMLVVLFRQANDPRAKPKAVYDAFMNTIMGSIQVDYSADALRQKAEAEKQFPGEKLAENLPPLEWDAQPVETEFELLPRICDQFNPNNETFLLPNGERDTARHEKINQDIDEEIARVQTAQKKALDEIIKRVLASHMDFN